jgi:hypothetical protein
MALQPLTKKMLAAFNNWQACNEFLRTATEDEAATLLHHERKGKQRVQYMLRMHARMNRERAQRERLEILGGK